MSRAELWKELYTRAIEREAETSKNEEEPEASSGEQGDSSGEPVSLNSCWKFVLSNLTAGNHLFQVGIMVSTFRVNKFLSHLLIVGCDESKFPSVRPFIHLSVDIYVEVWFSLHQ